MLSLFKSCDFVLINSSLKNFSTVPVITIPKYLESRLKWYEKQQERKAEQKLAAIASLGPQNILIISSKYKPKLNHYAGRVYDKKKEIPLASSGWKNSKYNGDIITFHAHKKNPHFENCKFLPDDFKFNLLGLDDNVIDALHSLNITRLTNIQLEAIPNILKGGNFLLSGETGCGKTLAYLVPLIQKLINYKKHTTNTNCKHPLALIILPSRELVEQIGNIALKLCSSLGIGVALNVGGYPRNISHTGYDMVISTIGILGKLLKTGVYSLGQLKHMVLDEADTLLDDSFNFNIYDILYHLKFKDRVNTYGVEIILVSATIPSDLERVIGDYVDLKSFMHISTKNVMYISPHVKHVFHRINKYDRNINLLNMLNDLKDSKTIIFSNTSKGSNWLYHYINENGFKCARLNKYVQDDERLYEYDLFCSGEANILSSSDLGSRGIDLKDVNNVINFDCPLHIADYIHRAGRTGRVGATKQCSIYTYVSFKPNIKLVNELEMSKRLNRPITLNTNVKSIINEYRKNKKLK